MNQIHTTFGSVPLRAACAVNGGPEDPLTARHYSEPPHAYRSPFQRDRARIIHSRAFRRLAGKTQVFTHGYSDHYRSRLTHTIEVTQLARTIATALGLNGDLTESLALVHDIGHPPFGHAGEHALDEAMRAHGLRFDHNLHALRIVTAFEQRYVAFPGLNLTLGVREGIIKHSRDYDPAEYPELAEYFLDQQPPLEAQLIDLADEIAYLAADFDDGFSSGILDLSHVRAHVALFERYYAPMALDYPDAAPDRLIDESLKRMLNALTSDLITRSGEAVAQAGITSLAQVRNAGDRLILLSDEMEGLRREAKQYLGTHLYESDAVTPEHERAQQIITSLYECWVRDPSLLPANCQAATAQEGAPRTVADYIAGMTDPFLLTQYEKYRGLCSS
ncbi:MAG TPA: dNTP triphosphohydrolase [Acidobacteriaceae bacterium]|nr:dNTP triphosphohydrolase [Acidobacteriaceae bacterium]